MPTSDSVGTCPGPDSPRTGTARLAPIEPVRSCSQVPAGTRLLKLGRGGDPVRAEEGCPELRQVVVDCTDARAVAEFYRRLLGLRYRPGDEPPAAGEPDV